MAALVPILGVLLAAAVLAVWRAHREIRRQGTYLRLRGDGWHRLHWNDLREAWSCPDCGATAHGFDAVVKHREDSHCGWFKKHRPFFDSIRASYEATGAAGPMSARQIPDEVSELIGER